MASIPTFDEVTPVAAMETIADLYKTGFLEPAPADKLQAKPSAAINDKVVIIQGDITQIECDAVVNAANESLLGGGGVDGAIHHAAGRGLVQECATLNGCRTGAAKITGGYRLPAKHVIHTVGPIYFRHRAESPALLESCYRESLRVAVANGVRSIVFCCISTGIYGYPNDDAAHVACETVRRSLEENASKLDKVVFCLFLPRDVRAYRKAAPYYFPDSPEESTKDEDHTKDEEPAKGEESAKDKEADIAETSERGDPGVEEAKDGEKSVAEETKEKEEEWEEIDKAAAMQATDTKTAAEGSDTKPETEAEKKD